MEEIRVRSWAELNDCLYERSWDPRHGRFRSPYVFRGLPDFRYDRRTSLNRLGGNYAELEDDLLRNFRKYTRQADTPGDSWWNWLAVAQHHGLPTRLLDWTFSPYVALHFVTEKYDLFNVDGVVWAINIAETLRLLPPVLRGLLERDGATVFSADLLGEYSPTIPGFDQRVANEGPPCCVFFEPPSLDERIVNQAALFSMMSSPSLQLDDWLREHERAQPNLFHKILIPASLKWEVRDKLDMANINERVIYPGLDGLSSWLKRYYSPNHFIEVSYPGESARPARIEAMEDGVITISYMAPGGQKVTTRIKSRGGVEWWDINRQSVVFVKPRPSRV